MCGLAGAAAVGRVKEERAAQGAWEPEVEAVVASAASGASRVMAMVAAADRAVASKAAVGWAATGN